jgi:hypothetical protein
MKTGISLAALVSILTITHEKDVERARQSAETLAGAKMLLAMERSKKAPKRQSWRRENGPQLSPEGTVEMERRFALGEDDKTIAKGMDIGLSGVRARRRMWHQRMIDETKAEMEKAA